MKKRKKENDENVNVNINIIPEVLIHVTEYLPLQTILQLYLINKTWFQIIKSPYVWKQQCKNFLMSFKIYEKLINGNGNGKRKNYEFENYEKLFKKRYINYKREFGEYSMIQEEKREEEKEKGKGEREREEEKEKEEEEEGEEEHDRERECGYGEDLSFVFGKVKDILLCDKNVSDRRRNRFLYKFVSMQYSKNYELIGFLFKKRGGTIGDTIRDDSYYKMLIVSVKDDDVKVNMSLNNVIVEKGYHDENIECKFEKGFSYFRLYSYVRDAEVVCMVLYDKSTFQLKNKLQFDCCNSVYSYNHDRLFYFVLSNQGKLVFEVINCDTFKIKQICVFNSSQPARDTEHFGMNIEDDILVVLLIDHIYIYNINGDVVELLKILPFFKVENGADITPVKSFVLYNGFLICGYVKNDLSIEYRIFNLLECKSSHVVEYKTESEYRIIFSHKVNPVTISPLNNSLIYVDVINNDVYRLKSIEFSDENMDKVTKKWVSEEMKPGNNVVQKFFNGIEPNDIEFKKQRLFVYMNYVILYEKIKMNTIYFDEYKYVKLNDDEKGREEDIILDNDDTKMECKEVRVFVIKDPSILVSDGIYKLQKVDAFDPMIVNV